MLSEDQANKIRTLLQDHRVEFVSQGIEFLELFAHTIKDIEQITDERVPEDYDSWKICVRQKGAKRAHYYIWLLGKMAEYEITWVLNLGKIELRFLGLSTLPKSLFTLTNIHSLDIRNNPIVTLPKNLPALKVDQQQWEQLHSQIMEMESLRHLHLSNIGLTSLPEEISFLRNLESLFLQGNQLTTLPNNIGQLTKLRVLNISRNSLKKIPPSFFQLETLKDVNLSKNRLTEFSKEWGSLVQLTTIILNNNRLSEVPDTLIHLSKLRTLDLSNNRLIHLPESIGYISSLVNLSVSNNYTLTQFPNKLSLPNLRSINISFTRLEPFPNISECSALEIIECQQVKCLSNELPKWLGALPKIKRINASGVRLPQSFHSTIIEWKSRFTVYVDHFKQ